MLQVDELTTRYGALTALHSVSLHVDTGELVTLIAPNGAGKTTLMATIIGLLRPAGGTVTLDGADITRADPATLVRQGVALVPDFLAQDFSQTTPTAVLLAALPVDELEHTVEAVLPNLEQQRLLGIDALEPCLALHRRSWSRGQVVTVATLTYPASRYALYSRYKTSAKGTLTQ